VVHNAIAPEMVKLKQVITAKNVLSKSMQANLGAGLQKLKKLKRVLATTEVQRDMVCEKVEYISKMYFSHWEPLGMSERMWSENLDASNSW